MAIRGELIGRVEVMYRKYITAGAVLKSSESHKQITNYNEVVAELIKSERDQVFGIFFINVGDLYAYCRMQTPFHFHESIDTVLSEAFKTAVAQLWEYIRRPENVTKVPQGRKNFYAMSNHELRTEAVQHSIDPELKERIRWGRYAIDRPRVLKELLEADSYYHNSQINQFHGPVSNSIFQQGRHDTATINIASDDTRLVMEEIRKFIADTRLSEGDRNEMGVQLDTVETQMKSRNPKHGIIKECLLSIRHIAEHAIGASLAHEALPHLISYSSSGEQKDSLRRVNSWVRPLRKLRLLRYERTENKRVPLFSIQAGLRIPLSPPASLTCRETLASVAAKSAKQAHFSQSLLDKTRLQRMHYPAARWPLRGFSLKHQRAVEF
jgi:hypothetical protein